jgi:hypothetical protein
MVVNKCTTIALIALMALNACRPEHNDAAYTPPHTPVITPAAVKHISTNFTTPPLAMLQNIPDYCDTAQSFVLQLNANVRIYGVGELVRPLALVEQPYYLKNDDLEFFFHSAGKDQRQFLFTWMEGYTGISNGKESQIFFSKKIDLGHGAVDFLISIPWNEVGCTRPKEGGQLDFDVAIGDNDDGVRQEGKIAWHTDTDPLLDPQFRYGKLVLSGNKEMAAQPGTVYSRYNNTDSIPWDAIAATTVEKVIAGEVKDKSDCYALIKSCWDKHRIYFKVRVNDSYSCWEERYISKEKAHTLKTLCDYGWIEDEKGQVVWAMNALNTAFGGGCVKNRLADTVLSLKAGTYTLKYSSDESHAYGHWDAAPPLTPFYGIAVYPESLKNENHR